MYKIFNNISLKNQEKLFKILRTINVKYKKDSKIFDLFKDDQELGIIVSGHIQVIKNNYNGTITIIDELFEGDLIGYPFLYIKNDEYDIIVKEDTEILAISYESIMQDINDKSYNQFVKNLLLFSNEKIIERNERISILSKKTIREKLLEYFNINARKNGSKYIYLPFTFTDLASYLSIDRSAMSREISYLKEEGFIEIKGKKITLLYRQKDNLLDY